MQNELLRAENACRVIRKADTFLREGNRDALYELGFSRDHVAELMAQTDGGRQGYPQRAKRNAQWHLAWLRRIEAQSKPQEEPRQSLAQATRLSRTIAR